MPELITDIDPTEATFSFRIAQQSELEITGWDSANALRSRLLVPWRTFRWWYGQRHYSGTYWSRTQRDHVIYESRLELARLIYADFDPDVASMVAQPFLLEAKVDGRHRRHVPDYLLETSSGPTVVDVKPLHRLEAPKVAHTLGWTRQVVEACGWSYEVWTEPPAIELANLRFVGGYRDERRLNEGLIEGLTAWGSPGRVDI